MCTSPSVATGLPWSFQWWSHNHKGINEIRNESNRQMPYQQTWWIARLGAGNCCYGNRARQPTLAPVVVLKN